MFLLMLGAAGLYLVLGGVAEGAFLTLAAFATVALVLVQEVRSERALRALRDLAEPTARVIRGGVETKIPARNLVPGDVLLVGEGQRLPADCRLIAGEVLAVDEAALTGESAPVTKFPDPGEDQVAAAVSSAQLFAGTLVVQGQGVARVELTGGRTTFGQIGISLAAIDYSPTPLQKASGRMVRWIGGLGLGFCVLVVVAYGVIRGDWLEGGLAGITIAISLIPEEFPMVLAIFLALGAWRLAQGRVLVRRSAAIEALGGATVLCVDKTGTLTENRMSLERLWAQGQTYRGIWAQMPVQSQQVLEAAVMASAARPTDPMDRALWAQVSPDRPRREPAKIWPLQKDRLAVVQVWPAADLGAGLAIGPRQKVRQRPYSKCVICRRIKSRLWRWY